MTTIKIINLLDQEIPLRKINQTLVAEVADISQAYVNQILHGVKKNLSVQYRVRKAIIKLYGNKFTVNNNNKDKKPRYKTQLKKVS